MIIYDVCMLRLVCLRSLIQYHLSVDSESDLVDDVSGLASS
jgi:hypothetical protein